MNYKEYYKIQLKEGNEYQDYILHELINNGICFVNYSTKKYQKIFGENSAGIELKYDKKFRKTGNLYIEVAEKANPENINYIKSGIYRDDNSWLFLIGDYETYWLFSKKLLVQLIEAGKYEYKKTPTSQGYLIPTVGADKYCAKKYNTFNSCQT